MLNQKKYFFNISTCSLSLKLITNNHHFDSTQQVLTFDDLKKCRSLDLLSSSIIGLNKETSESEDELDVKLNEYLRLTDENINIFIEERNEWIRSQFHQHFTSNFFIEKSYIWAAFLYLRY